MSKNVENCQEMLRNIPWKIKGLFNWRMGIKLILYVTTDVIIFFYFLQKTVDLNFLTYIWTLNQYQVTRGSFIRYVTFKKVFILCTLINFIRPDSSLGSTSGVGGAGQHCVTHSSKTLGDDMYSICAPRRREEILLQLTVVLET